MTGSTDDGHDVRPAIAKVVSGAPARVAITPDHERYATYSGSPEDYLPTP